MTRYISTRGKAPVHNFADTTLAGLARDGGLYVPEVMPQITPADFAGTAQQSYLETAWRVMTPFIGNDIPSADLVRMVKSAYGTFDRKDVAPLNQIGDDFYLLELFHGPTLAFKDVALQFLGQVFTYILDQRRQRATIVGATSGDTGSAAIHAFKGKKNVDIFILHPHNRVSEVQRRQMTTVPDENVHNIAIDGSFDDCQDLVKAMFADHAFRDSLHLSAVNSINWARILAQVVYYVHSAALIHARTGRAPVFCVPTGNFGNVYAGYIAKSMGVPVEKFLVATNSNDILHRFFTTGRMKSEGSTFTVSPSMDIQVSSNFERLLFEVFGRQGAAVDATMRHFREKGPYHLEPSAMQELLKTFSSGRKDDAETLDIMRRMHGETGYMLDPHTAVGVGVAQDYKSKHPDSVIVSLATAHAAKFPDAARKATGITPALPAHMADLYDRAERFDVMQPDLALVQKYVRERVKV